MLQNLVTLIENNNYSFTEFGNILKVLQYFVTN